MGTPCAGKVNKLQFEGPAPANGSETSGPSRMNHVFIIMDDEAVLRYARPLIRWQFRSDPSLSTVESTEDFVEEDPVTN